MADTTTLNYSFVRPEIGGSTDTWGTKLNANWTAADAAIKANADAAAAAQLAVDNLAFSASEINYANATSGLTATDVQAAIDEVVSSTSSNEVFRVKGSTQTITTTGSSKAFVEVTGWDAALSITLADAATIEISAILYFDGIHALLNDVGFEFALTNSSETGGEQTITAISRAIYEYEINGASSSSKNMLIGTATLRARLSLAAGAHTYKLFARNIRQGMGTGVSTLNIQGSATEQNSTVLIREIL